MYLDILHIVFILLCVSLASSENITGPVQCLDGCSMSPALLGQDPTIGGCCGLQGRNGGGFLLADASVCINCTNFRTLTAQITHSTDPIMPEVDASVVLLCQVQVEELLCPSGTLSLQIANGSIITTTISSSVSEIIFNFNPFTAEDFGKYYCNVTILSPQFPQVGLRAFQGLELEGKIPTSTSTTATSATTSAAATSAATTTSVATSTPASITTAAATTILATTTTTTDFVPSATPSPTDITTPVTDSMGTSSVPTTNTIQPTTAATTNSGSIPTSISTTAFTTIQTTADTTIFSITTTTVSTDTPTVVPTIVTLPTTSVSQTPTALPPSPPILVIVCPRPPVLGKPYELTCMSNRLNVQIQWLLVNGEPIMNALIGSLIIDNQTGLSSLTIVFHPLSTEHIQEYICGSASSSVVVALAFEINECMEKLDDCHHDAKCIDRKEGYECVCKFGYYGNGTYCRDIDECTGDKSPCHSRASCHNFSGGYFCHCNHGFWGNGRKCFYNKY